MTYNYSQTLKYYAEWLDISVGRFDERGIVLIETEKRRICPTGHSKNLELYCAAFSDSLFISFSPELNKTIRFEKIFNQNTGVAEGVVKLNSLFSNKLIHRRAHYYTVIPKNINLSKAVKLQKEQYDDYYAFFMDQHPNSSPDEWLNEYYVYLVENSRCYGIYENGVLASVTGAPDVPYMQEIITEPGIETLPQYKNKGYASAVCIKYLQHALNKNEVPIWTCLNNNAASCKLAEKIGYKHLCDLFTVEGTIAN